MPLALLLACVAIDGDTLRCGRERVRLLGIDSPEFHCPSRRACVSGDPAAAKRSLAAAIAGHKVRFQRYGRDRFGRTLARGWVGRAELSCLQMKAGQAVYIAKWDVKRAVAIACGV